MTQRDRTRDARIRELSRAHVSTSWSAQDAIDPLPIAGREGACFWDPQGRRFLGRTGAWFALDHWGVEADLISFAKGVNSGCVPLGDVRGLGVFWAPELVTDRDTREPLHAERVKPSRRPASTGASGPSSSATGSTSRRRA